MRHNKLLDQFNLFGGSRLVPLLQKKVLEHFFKATENARPRNMRFILFNNVEHPVLEGCERGLFQNLFHEFALASFAPEDID